VLLGVGLTPWAKTTSRSNFVAEDRHAGRRYRKTAIVQANAAGLLGVPNP